MFFKIHLSETPRSVELVFQADVFWAVTPCSAVVGYRRFRGSCYYHLHFTLHGVTTQKTST